MLATAIYKPYNPIAVVTLIFMFLTYFLLSALFCFINKENEILKRKVTFMSLY